MSLYHPKISISMRLQYYYITEIIKAAKGTHQSLTSKKCSGRILSFASVREIMNYIKNLEQEQVVARFMSPITYYFVFDRLFMFQEGNLVYKLLTNNKVSKYPLRTVIDYQRRFIDCRLADY